MQLSWNLENFFSCMLYILGLKTKPEKRKLVIREVIKEIVGSLRKQEGRGGGILQVSGTEREAVAILSLSCYPSYISPTPIHTHCHIKTEGKVEITTLLLMYKAGIR